MKILLTIIYFLNFYTVLSQEIYYTIAKSGLIIRSKPSISSNRIGKLPYGSTVKLLYKTTLKDKIIVNGNTINGFWVKIKFTNFPYIVSEFKNYESKGEGYVFNKFIEKLNKASITSKEIDSLSFYNLYKKSTTDLVKITSQKKIEKLLGSKVKWKDGEYLARSIDKIILDNGQILHLNQESDYGLVAYYPTEQTLLFEGGHTSDFSISIKTGESLKTVGNPEYIKYSPSKKFRLNGWYPGQECSSYFFQEKVGGKYIYVVNFGFGEKFGKNICNFNNFCWLNDVKFVYSYTGFFSGKRMEKYFIGEITKNKTYN